MEVEYHVISSFGRKSKKKVFRNLRDLLVEIVKVVMHPKFRRMEIEAIDTRPIEEIAKEINTKRTRKLKDTKKMIEEIFEREMHGGGQEK